jgi:hypothetical protein
MSARAPDGRDAEYVEWPSLDHRPEQHRLAGYLIVERGEAPVDDLVDVASVAGVWWYRGSVAPDPYSTDARGLQVTYCHLDQDPVGRGAARAGGATALGFR